MEGIEVEMFNEVDAIELDHVYFGTKLYLLNFFTPYNGTNVTLGY